MARSFSSAEARQLIAEHTALQSELSGAIGRIEEMQAVVRSAVEAYRSEKALDLLREIPIEEVNRNKLGLRVKALRESGICTMADAATASPRRLTAVRGISAEGARTIQQIASDYQKEAQKGVRLRLNADTRTRETSAIVRTIAVRRAAAPLQEDCAQLVQQYGGKIARWTAELRPGTGGLRWFFTGKENKQRAEAAFQELVRLREGEYWQRAQAVLSALRAAECTDLQSAWEDFARHSIDYTAVIEQIDPDLLGEESAAYGLPEELAQAVEAHSIDLNGHDCQLRRYQLWGVWYILHQKRVILGDEMGLGKTVQAIAAMVALKNDGETHFLVVCPASVLPNWCREIGEKSDLQPVKLHGPDRDEALEQWWTGGGVAVTTYETSRSLDLPEDLSLGMLVVDEAHYIKNPQAKRSRSVRALCGRSERILFMTGTALENNVQEMLSLIRILRPEIADRAKRVAMLITAPAFRREIAEVYYRRKREDVLTELPDLIEKREWCELGPVEETAYEQALLRGNPMAARRVSWNVEDLRRSSKACRMLEIIEDAAADGRKVLVFSFFLDTLAKVAALLGEQCMEPITGSVPVQRRQEILDEFEKAPAGTVLAAQIQAGGTGLNIQAASVVILCEPQLKPSTENQAISRAYRMGQSRNVLVYRLLCEDTIDERITRLLARKQRAFDAFADESEAARQEAEIDETSLRALLEEEAARIRQKHTASPVSLQEDVPRP